MAQKRTNDEAEEGVGFPGHGKELGFSKCDCSHWEGFELGYNMI